MNIEEILRRADVIWYNDPLNHKRVVISRNLEAPLTKDEQETIRKMWEDQLNGMDYEIEFV